jgi:hypothetical protein
MHGSERNARFGAPASVVRPRKINARVGEIIRTPWLGPGKPTPTDVALLELRGEVFIRDHTAAVTVADGFIQIADLPAGDYTLR